MSSEVVQVSDQFQLQNANTSPSTAKVSRGKDVKVVFDNNQGGYTSGEVNFDCTGQLTGSQGFAALNEQYISVPYVITAKNGSVPPGKGIPRHGVALKCGVWNIISDFELEMNGQKVVSYADYRSFWSNIRAQTEISQDYLTKHGAELALSPDNWYSINFINDSSSSGDGYSNNACNPKSTYDIVLNKGEEPRSFNNGFFNRLSSVPMLADEELAQNSFKWATLGSKASIEIARQSGNGCFVDVATPADQTTADKVSGTWVYMLKIPLVWIHPIFKELDLVSNPQMRMKFKFNTGTTKISATGANQYKLDSTINTTGSVCPIMVAGAGTDEMLNGVFTAANQSISFSYGVLQNQHTTLATVSKYVPYTMCRLHVPFYDPVDYRQIVNNPIKSVKYLECYAQYFNSGQGGKGVSDKQLNAAFNLPLSATVKNLKYVAVLPFAETSSGHFSTATNTEQFQSPFDSAPWTVQPGSYIRNFNVQVGNKNVFSSSHDYSYQSFLDEFTKLSAINGDLSHELSNGLIDIDHWTYSNRVMIADCSRLTEPDVPMSIQISGTNASCQGANLLALAVHEKKLDINRLTGEITKYE